MRRGRSKKTCPRSRAGGGKIHPKMPAVDSSKIA
jgi:hypothetical protein